MSSGMNLEQAKEYAKTMTYSEAVSNVKYSKFIKYRKATMIKLRELAEIADKLDRKTEPSFKVDEIGDDDPTIHAIAYLQKVGWLQEHDRALTEPQTERSNDA